MTSGRRTEEMRMAESNLQEKEARNRLKLISE